MSCCWFVLLSVEGINSLCANLTSDLWGGLQCSSGSMFVVSSPYSLSPHSLSLPQTAVRSCCRWWRSSSSSTWTRRRSRGPAASCSATSWRCSTGRTWWGRRRRSTLFIGLRHCGAPLFIHETALLPLKSAHFILPDSFSKIIFLYWTSQRYRSNTSTSSNNNYNNDWIFVNKILIF